MTREEARRIAEYLGANYRTELPAATMAIWLDGLWDVPYRAGQVAAKRWCVEVPSAFMPSLGEFRGLCRTVAKRAREAERDSSRELAEGSAVPLDAVEVLDRITDLQRVLAGAVVKVAPSVKRVRPGDDERRVPVAPPFCSRDDHRFCGSMNARRDQPREDEQ